MSKRIIQSAYDLVEESIIYFEGKPVGTKAAMDLSFPAAENYSECFIRDFVPCALIFLADGKTDIVRNFLETVLSLRTSERTISGHEIQPGVMPASFTVIKDQDGKEQLKADFGERAIGRVAPVDSMMWWMILLYVYVQSTGDKEFAHQPNFQFALQQILHLCLKDTFEVSPALLVPDASSMIDRRMGIYGYPLEIQSLFYGTLRIMHYLLLEPNMIDRRSTDKRRAGDHKIALTETAGIRQEALKNYVREYYWLDLKRLNEIHCFKTEEFGEESTNVLNIYPESIPDWVTNWLPTDSGYMVGNVGVGRMDFRFFSLGNLLAILFNLSSPQQGEGIMKLFERRWPDLIGDMPLKIIFPAMEGKEWQIRTGSDPKNMAWSYQNGGNWPTLLWPFVAAALKTGRGDLGERAFEICMNRLPGDKWPEYYDGRAGRLVGRRANINQTWSAAALILSEKLLENPSLLNLLPE